MAAYTSGELVLAIGLENPVLLPEQKKSDAGLDAKMEPSSPNLNPIPSQELSIEEWINEYDDHFKRKFNFEMIDKKWIYNWLVVELSEWDQTERLKYGIDLYAWRATASAYNDVLRTREKLADLQTKMVIPDTILVSKMVIIRTNSCLLL